MLPSPIWVCVTLLIHNAENGCLRGLLLCTLELSYSYTMNKSSGLGKYIMCIAYSLWLQIMEESQKHICSFLLNKCHDCMRKKLKVDADQESISRAILTNNNWEGLRLLGNVIKKCDHKLYSIDFSSWMFTVVLKVCFSHTLSHHGWCRQPSDTALFFIIELKVPWWAHTLT